MVGYPGETEADFLESQGFCQSCGFAAMHVFPYSRRSGTPAAVAPDQVPLGVKSGPGRPAGRDRRCRQPGLP